MVTGEGSGFFITADGYAVTNYHVVDHARSVQVTADDGASYTAKVVGADPKTDLALIKVDGKDDFSFVKFAEHAPPLCGYNLASSGVDQMKSYLFPSYSALRLTVVAALLVLVSDFARAEMASIYGGRDGLCGRPTASGEPLNCAGMTAAHRTLAFGTRVRVCHSRCVTVRITDRAPWVRGRQLDLSPAAARAIVGL